MAAVRKIFSPRHERASLVNSIETYVLEDCVARGTLVIVLLFHRNSLETPTLGHSGLICIQFSYLMKGYWMGNLFVFVSSLGEHNYVFIHRDHIDDKWHRVAIPTTVSRADKVGRVFVSAPGPLAGVSQLFGRTGY